MTRKAIFNLVKAGRNGAPFNQTEVAALDHCLDQMGMPDDQAPPEKKVAFRTKLIAGLSTAALLATTGIVSKWEGRRNDPYQDIVGVWTVCDGETRVKMRRYSNAECDAMLAKAIKKDFAPPVLKCVPGLARRPEILAASISLAYNVGSSGFCKSTAARRFNAGNWRGGCNAFLMWNKAGGRVVKGLTNRRKDEQALCLSGI